MTTIDIRGISTAAVITRCPGHWRVAIVIGHVGYGPTVHRLITTVGNFLVAVTTVLPTVEVAPTTTRPSVS